MPLLFFLNIYRSMTTDVKITVADCGSRQRTKQTWSLDLIVDESNSSASAGGPFWIISK